MHALVCLLNLSARPSFGKLHRDTWPSSLVSRDEWGHVADSCNPELSRTGEGDWVRPKEEHQSGAAKVLSKQYPHLLVRD